MNPPFPHRNSFGKIRKGFTLAELLVVIAVIGILASLLLPVLRRGAMLGRRAQCTSNLRQLVIATQLYWDDNGGDAFRYRRGATNGGDLYWFGWLEKGSEGDRVFDPTMGALFPYLARGTVEICPSMRYHLSSFKLKATTMSYGYGYNLHLSMPLTQPPFNISQMQFPCETAVFADAAQVNTFQPPASPQNPMIEEFYYVSTQEPTAHFRHDGYALAAFCDSHVAAEKPVAASLDLRLSGQRIGRLRSEVLRPR